MSSIQTPIAVLWLLKLEMLADAMKIVVWALYFACYPHPATDGVRYKSQIFCRVYGDCEYCCSFAERGRHI